MSSFKVQRKIAKFMTSTDILKSVSPEEAKIILEWVVQEVPIISIFALERLSSLCSQNGSVIRVSGLGFNVTDLKTARNTLSR